MILRISGKFIITVLFVSAALFGCAAASFAEQAKASSGMLLDDPGLYDGRTISFEGEIIGDIMKQGRYAWININDGRAAIGVFAAAGDVKGLSAGGYRRQGDIVRISGEFHNACPRHGGDMDIHADSVTVIIKSAVKEEIICPVEKRLAVLLAGVLCLLSILMLCKKLRKKR